MSLNEDSRGQQQDQTRSDSQTKTHEGENNTVQTKAAFLKNVVAAFTIGLDPDTLHGQSRALTASLREKSVDLAAPSMLPSFIGRSPSGHEYGRAIAVDIGGSTMRVAVVRLDPASKTTAERALCIEHLHQWSIGQEVKDLSGEAFFDWIAQNVEAFLLGHLGDEFEVHKEALLHIPLGLVWSFPLNQTHLNDGELGEMGKGFSVARDLKGKSMNACMQAAFQRAGLPLRLEAILNDSVSVLLAMAYLDPSTKLSVVAGTGFNGALQLPTSSVAPGKYGRRSPDWIQSAQHVLVDAELCVTGQGIFPRTEWDWAILEKLPRAADALGLELLIGGFFVGEVIREVIVDAVQTVALLDGQLPESISNPFSLQLETVAMILRCVCHLVALADAFYYLEMFSGSADAFVRVHSDDDEIRSAARERLTRYLGLSLPISDEDFGFLLATSQVVMDRTAAFLSAAVHAMQYLHNIALKETLELLPSMQSAPCTISCIGSVIEKCPGFLKQCQAYIDGLQAKDSAAGCDLGSLHLVVAADSSLTGVAVAALMARLQHVCEVEKNTAPEVETATFVSNETELAAATKDGLARPPKVMADTVIVAISQHDLERRDIIVTAPQPHHNGHSRSLLHSSQPGQPWWRRSLSAICQWRRRKT